MKTIVRSIWRAVVPIQIRKGFVPWAIRAYARGSPWHRLRWHLLPKRATLRQVERRLSSIEFWLFVLGATNSGTTMLVKILNSHPSIHALPREGSKLTAALPDPRRFRSKPYGPTLERCFALRPEPFRWIENDDPGPKARICFDWSRYVPKKNGILLEKSPTDMMRARWLQQQFRPSRFISIVRDPHAVCEGIKRRSGNSIEDAARHWARAHEILLRDIPYLEHCLLLTYEDLCHNTEEVLRDLESFLGLDEPFDLNALQSLEVHNIDDRPTSISSFNEKSLCRLSPEDRQTISTIAGPLMKTLGYLA